MARKRVDLCGNRYGRIEVLRYIGNCTYEIRCDCGTVKNASSGNISSGRTLSCGCLRNESRTKHGRSGTAQYKAWHGMVQRCTNKNHAQYSFYGGRGIDVPANWLTYEGFYEGMGERPEGCELDRIDNDLGYSKENCRWVSHKVNCQNTRKTYRWFVNWRVFYSAKDAGDFYGVNENTIKLWCMGGINNGDGKYKNPKKGCGYERLYRLAAEAGVYLPEANRFRKAG